MTGVIGEPCGSNRRTCDRWVKLHIEVRGSKKGVSSVGWEIVSHGVSVDSEVLR